MAIIKYVLKYPDFKVQIVTSSPDLLVYITKKIHEARDSDYIWFFYDSHLGKRVQFDNDSPDLKIKYVDDYSEAGWINKNHKLMGKIKATMNDEDKISVFSAFL